MLRINGYARGSVVRISGFVSGWWGLCGVVWELSGQEICLVLFGVVCVSGVSAGLRDGDFEEGLVWGLSCPLRAACGAGE